MPTLICTRGLPGSGKSTWARQWVTEAPNRARISRDDLRENVFGMQGLLSNDNEAVVTSMERAQAKALLKAGRDVVVDAQNLRMSYLREWKQLATEVGAGFHIEDFTRVPLEAVLQQNANRLRVVDEDYIRSQHAKFVAGKPPIVAAQVPVKSGVASVFTPYVPDESLPSAYIFDIDGTLAHMVDRDPYDYPRAIEDTVDEVVRGMLWMLEGAGAKILIVSGRSDDCQDVTEAWLEKNLIEYDTLLMRKTGDYRKDAIVKNEIFERDIAPFYNVRCVFDDRNQVVEMWRAKGIKCLQVQEGAF